MATRRKKESSGGKYIILCLIGIIAILAILAVIIFLIMKYDSAELDETSPFFNDEIEEEGIENIKFKNK